jgi:ribonuclease HI
MRNHDRRIARGVRAKRRGKQREPVAIAAVVIGLVAWSTVPCAVAWVCALRLDWGATVVELQRAVARRRFADVGAFKWALLCSVIPWLPLPVMVPDVVAGSRLHERLDAAWLLAEVKFGAVVGFGSHRWSQACVERSGRRRLVERLLDALSSRFDRRATDRALPASCRTRHNGAREALMAQVRMLYRGCKVWVDADEAGKPLLQRGLAKVRYRPDDKASYSAKESEIAALPPAAPEVISGDGSSSGAAATGAGDSSDAPPRRRRPAARRPRAKPAGATPRAARSADGADTLVIYADGSCFGNPGPAGLGVLLEWKGKVKEISRYLGLGTNNIAELTAIEAALEAVKNRNVRIRIHTDSQYSIGVLCEGWKVKANRELVERIQALMAGFPDLALVKVRGHAGDPRNERVDQLARDAILRRGAGGDAGPAPVT